MEKLAGFEPLTAKLALEIVVPQFCTCLSAQSPLSANIIAAIGHGLAQLVAFDVDADDANNVDVDGGVDIFG